MLVVDENTELSHILHTIGYDLINIAAKLKSGELRKESGSIEMILSSDVNDVPLKHSYKFKDIAGITLNSNLIITKV